MHIHPVRLVSFALFGLLSGCLERSASVVDPADPLVDGAPPDAIIDGAPLADRGDVLDAAPDSAPLDAAPADAAVDASPDLAVPDAAPHPTLEPFPLFSHAGRARCPDAVAGPDGWTVAWTAGAGDRGPGDTLWTAGIARDGAIRAPAPVDAVDGQTLVGPIRLSRAGIDLQIAGAATAGDRRPIDVWLADMDGRRRATWSLEPDADPDVVSMAQFEDETWVLLPRGDRLELVLIDPAGETVSTRDVGPLADAASLIAVGHASVALGRVDGEVFTLTMRRAGEVDWRAELPVARPEFDLSTNGGSIAVAYLADDPALVDMPFGAGYGRPELRVFSVADGTRSAAHPLSPTPVRGDRPTIARYGDGWLTAWSRLRVDADRNRTEIEATFSRADGLPLLSPRRITRAHGFSFCPVAADGDDRAFIAWLDTRDGAEDIYATVGHPSLWPAADASPEPGLAPPGIPADCAEPQTVTDEFASSLRAVPTDTGLSAVYATLDDVLVAIDIDRDGTSTPVTRWAPGGDVGALFVARSGAALVVGASIDGTGRVWRVGDEGAIPIEGGAADGPLLGLAASAGGIVSATATPAGLRLRFAGAGPDGPRVIDIDGTDGVADVALGGGERGFGLAWIDPVDGSLHARRFDGAGLIDGAGALDPLPSGDLFGLTDLGVAIDDRGMWLSASAHRGRPFARAAYVWRIDDEGAGMPIRLDADAAASRSPRLATDPAGGLAVWWIDEKPVQRFEAHLADRIADGAARIRRVPIPGPARIELFMRPDGDDALALWRAGVQVFVARSRSACLPTARFVP